MHHGNKELHLTRQCISIQLPMRAHAGVQNNSGRMASQNGPHTHHNNPQHEPRQMRRTPQAQIQGGRLVQVLRRAKQEAKQPGLTRINPQ